MISDSAARPIANHVASKSFRHLHDPNKFTIQQNFHDNWDNFLKDPEVVRRGFRLTVLEEVDKMLVCGTLESGYEIFECPNCNKFHIICYTCKSRFCNSCGSKYAKQRAATISANTLDVRHRHVVFTVDERLREFFLRERGLLSILFNSAKETLNYTFQKMKDKHHTIKPGFILTLHTFGRSLNFNPHIHCLLTEGGIDEDENNKAIQYIHYETLRRSFMKQLLDNLKLFYQDNPKYLKKSNNLSNNSTKTIKMAFMSMLLK